MGTRLSIRPNISFLERQFDLAAHGTTPWTEVLAGFTTFATLAYILFVQPALLSSVGLDSGGGVRDLRGFGFCNTPYGGAGKLSDRCCPGHGA